MHDRKNQLEPLALEDALNILTEETRAQILIELGQAWGEGGPVPAVLSYSELMDRVDVQDSGRFNYHLDKLVGPFVKKVEDGYVLHLPGHLLYQAIIAGTLTDRPTSEPAAVGRCPDCDGTIEVEYRADLLVVSSCTDCETTLDRIPFPPKAFEDREGDELIDAAVQKQYHELSLFRRGVCYGCGGQVHRQLRATVPADWTLPFDSPVYCFLRCTVCQAQLITEPAHVALTTPVVSAFFADHNRDPAVIPSWDDVLSRANDTVTVESESPLEVSVLFDITEDQITVHLDSALAVISSCRN